MIVKTKESDLIGVDVSQKALEILMRVPPKIKGSPKKLRRLIRIRHNLFREVEALNRELRRHRPDSL